MPSHRVAGQFRAALLLLFLAALACLCALPTVAQTRAAGSGDNQVVLEEIEGKVEFRAAGTTDWLPAKSGQALKPGDWLRTGERSRAAVRVGESVIRKSELTTVEIQPPPPQGKQPTLDVKAGLLYFFSRDKPRELRLRTPLGAGAIRGTEFNLAVATDGTTVLTLIDGEVELSNDRDTVRLVNGEAGKIEPGKAPTKTAVLQSETVNLIQWCLYYPAVLDTAELGLSAGEQQALSASLAAYRNGDLLKALESLPQERTAASAPEQVYRAALLLSVGQVAKAERFLDSVARQEQGHSAGDGPGCRRLIQALRAVIAAVKFQPRPAGADSTATGSASVDLAESYLLQSESRLADALASARRAAAESPAFGFAWTRVAELEFSFGRISQARLALEKGLTLAPQNAQALALQGFLLSAENRWTEAVAAFDRAIAADGALGNAWLGRGLVRIRSGALAAGRADLQMAAALEPHRALLRSYLGKAFNEGRDFARANKELELAKRLDAQDPTAWLYSSLLNRDQNRINAAVADLEHSQDLNTNRSVFRSRLLLDQDQAVRGANLAAIYRDAGLTDVAVREAGRAVNYDYANYSAHLFLANSYDALRDPRQVSLRYETPWFNELLLANLLAPVGAGSLSQTISQQEYSKLFERDRFGVSSGTEYLSRGDWQTYGSQFGNFGNLGYAFDAVYLSQHGQQPNSDLDQLTFYGKVKQQLSPKDTLFLEAIYYNNESGDVRQYYNPAWSSPSLRFKERQEPDLFAGFHHEWGPGSHTLLLAGRLDDQVTLHAPDSTILTLARNPDGSLRRALEVAGFDQRYRSTLEAYSAEGQQLWQQGAHTLVAGGRFQTGTVRTESEIARDPNRPPLNLLGPAPVAQANATDLERASFYGYYQRRVIDSLQVIGGVSYDRLIFPVNVDFPPIAQGERTKDQISPKAGFIWSIAPRTHLRGAYTRSLGGLYYDTSVRLEPTQVAGFLQAFRSAAPESVTGLVPGSQFESAAVGLDHRFGSGTYVGIQGELLNSKADRAVGVFDWPSGFPVPPAQPASVTERLDYRERVLSLGLNQLLGEDWAFGARYRLSDVRLNTEIPELPIAKYAGASSNTRGTLHELSLYALFNYGCGFFAQAESVWHAQSNRGYAPDLPGDDFWQSNFFAGYRFARRAAEVSVGLLNLTDQDYRLNPLNLYPDLPRSRTVAVRLKFNF